MSTMAISEVLEQKKLNPAASIEGNSSSTNNSIELPEEIDQLIDNKMYRRKFNCMIRNGHLSALLELAEIAKSKATPSRWFAVVTAKKNWDRTLEFLSKLRQAARIVSEVVERVAAPIEHVKAVYAAYWRSGGAIMQHAITAQEIGRDKFKFFCWLTRQKKETANITQSL
jgi:hypothetical protein